MISLINEGVVTNSCLLKGVVGDSSLSNVGMGSNLLC